MKANNRLTIIPAIDLRGGSCVRLSQGRKKETTVYDTDPVSVAIKFQKSGARVLHIVSLDGAFAETNSPNLQVLRKIIAATAMPIQFGGGLRTIEDIQDVLEAGVARVVIGTLAAESPDSLKELVRMFGSSRIAVGIDARDGRVLTRGWEAETSMTAVGFARTVTSFGIERVVYTDVSRDGMLIGLNVNETVRIARETGLKVTASGGVSSLEDLLSLKLVADSGVDSVIVGKALYEGRFSLQDAIAVARE